MPTISQILTQVQTQHPNSFSDTELLTWGNECLRKIWKHMNSDEIYRFNLIADQATYNLPTNGKAYDKIYCIDVAEDSTLETYNTHFWRGLLEELDAGNYFYKVTDNTFGLYPEPTTSITDGGVIFYGKKFTLMSSSDLTVTPAVNEDHHDIIVNYICMGAAGAGKHPNISARNNFAKVYNDALSAMLMDMIKTKSKTPLKNRSNAWWR